MSPHRSGGVAAVQPDSAILAVRLCVGVVPAVLCGGCIILLLFYDLKPETLERLRAARAWEDSKQTEA